MQLETISVKEYAQTLGISVQAVYKKLNTSLKEFKTTDSNGKTALLRSVLGNEQPQTATDETTADENTVKELLKMIEEKDKQIYQLQNQLLEQNNKLLKLVEQQQQLTLLAEQSRQPFFKRLLHKGK